jgi:hypothetical protein
VVRLACRIALVTLTGSFAVPTTAAATTQTAQSSDVLATFTFQGHFPRFSHLDLKITRAGVVAYSEPVTSSFCSPGCGPVLSAGAPSLRVLDLESNGQPDVVLSLSGYGGARCCLVDQVFSFDPAAMTYVASEHNFTATGAGVSIKDLARDGHFEFLSSDPAFFGAFADLAASAEPIQIWIFRRLRFIDVTCEYPKLIARDAVTWWRAFERNVSNGEGYLAAWAADEDLLGRSNRVKRLLANALREHRLRSESGSLDPDRPEVHRRSEALLAQTRVPACLRGGS